MAAIHAVRGGVETVVLDGAPRLGVKILVAGGGRCNVTHHEVHPHDYGGASRNSIAKVLRGFTVEDTIEFFREIGVALKKEETGKLFPVTDSAQTVLDALLGACRGAELRYPARVESITVESGGGFLVQGEALELRADRVILATGGKALPRSGSDGHGYALARGLGHSVTSAVFPALVPLRLAEGNVLRELSGITLQAELSVRRSSGKVLERFHNSTLLTHFGISGPSVLDVSRYLLGRRIDGEEVELVANWVPGETVESMDAMLLDSGGRGVAAALRPLLPDRLLKAFLEEAGVDGAASGRSLSRSSRRRLVESVVEMPLPVTGDRGFTHAETTAGGVPLSELRLDSMASRCCPGLHLVGEILDVDGRVGGFSFQWAWATGTLAGRAVVAASGH
ncbi:MAG: aminoacetone oxidase family FAD-binding enzyme [Phycisphaerales bacterium]|nr:aminoacetone oxidase family FAD-binding enzyme [Phycisphaerales bacterium]